MTIWIDADAAPKAVKEIVFRAAIKRRVTVVLVANSFMQTPRFRWISAVRVGAGLDVADDYIAEHCERGDLVITADIPLAAQVVDKGAIVLRFRGQVLDAANVKQRLAMRDLMDDLRGCGVTTGGPPPFGPLDRQRFANSLDRYISGSLRVS